MTNIRIKARKTRDRARSQIHIPHSSWSRTERTGPTEAIAPEDFWARLGL